MRKNILNKLLLLTVFVLTIVSCNDDSNSSVITSFEKFPLTMENTPGVIAEADFTTDSTVTFTFTFDEKQITPLHLTVGVGDESTAIEGEDFDLSTHTIDLISFEGREGFSIDVTVYEDGVVDEEDETIYLTFAADGPSGFDPVEMLVLTIEDSGLPPQPGTTVDFTLRWDFTNASDPLLENVDICDIVQDLDMTIQPNGEPIYAGTDLLAYEAATLSCPESGTLFLEDMNDGEEYFIWIAIYAGVDINYGDFTPLTVYVDYERANSSFSGTAEIEGVFDLTMEDEAFIQLSLVKNGNVLTLKDLGDNVIGSGRIGSQPRYQKVKKPDFLK